MVQSSFLIPGSIRKKERKKEKQGKIEKRKRSLKGEEKEIEKNVKACKGKKVVQFGWRKHSKLKKKRVASCRSERKKEKERE